MNPITFKQAKDYKAHKAQREAQEERNNILNIINTAIRDGVDELEKGKYILAIIAIDYNWDEIKEIYTDFEFDIRFDKEMGGHQLTIRLKPI